MKHVFLSQRPPASAAWRQAFPDAEITSQLGSQHMPPTIVWLHLQRQSAETLAACRQRGLLLIALSDVPGDEEGLAALAQGAAGYCNTNAAPEVLVQVADVVSRGGLWVGPELLNRLLRQASPRLASPNDNWATGLTPREAEIARHAANGASNREIAQALSITERTVKAHLTVVFEKLHIRDRLQLSLRIHGIQN